MLISETAMTGRIQKAITKLREIQEQMMKITGWGMLLRKKSLFLYLPDINYFKFQVFPLYFEEIWVLLKHRILMKKDTNEIRIHLHWAN